MSKETPNSFVEEPVAKRTLSVQVQSKLEEVVSCEGKYLEGKLLTLIDAIISEPSRCKATKDMVRDIMRKNYYARLYRTCYLLNKELGIIIDEEDKAYSHNTEDPHFFLVEENLDYIYSRK